MQRLGDKVWKNNLFVPSTDVYASSPDSPFMQYSTCSSRDFFHPEFKRLFGLLNFSPFFFHRKYPEWVFILHHISKHCDLAGQRGLGFGVGATEPLAAVFAKHHSDRCACGDRDRWRMGRMMRRSRAATHVAPGRSDSNHVANRTKQERPGVRGVLHVKGA